MKLFRQIIALLLACAFITGCAPKMEVGNNRSDSDASATVSASSAVAETNAPNTETPLITVGEPVMPEFSGHSTGVIPGRFCIFSTCFCA